MEAATSQALRSFDLDFRGMDVDSVEVNGAPATFERLGRKLKVIPDRPLARGRPFKVLVRYHGEPAPIGSQFVPWEVGWLQAEEGSVNVMNYPDGAETWFPVNDHQRDKATYDLEITAPSGWYVVGPGTLAASVEDEGWTRFVYTMVHPLASTSAGFHIDQYEIVALSQPGDAEAKLYVPEDAVPDLKQEFDVVPEAIEFLSEVFGPYPFQSYSVALADPWLSICLDYGLANSEQTVTLQCPTFYATNELTTVHELAHQWFGSSVSLVTLQDGWLLEGHATYAMWMWLSRQGDLDALDRLVRTKAAVYSPKIPIGEPPADMIAPEEVCTGGALLLHALRLRIGEQAFFETLRTFLGRYQYGSATTSDFIEVAEEVSGEGLQSFFDAWLHEVEPPLPDLPS
jgi:aminopeptidase N